MFCAPGVKGNDSSCFDQPALIRIIQDYNRRYPSKPINYHSQSQSGSGNAGAGVSAASGITLWNLIRDKLAETCGNDEVCWVNQDFLKNDATVQKYYKPLKPQGQTQWLSTSDINRVLKQFEDTYPDFVFMGTVPIDFDQIAEEYAKLDFCSLYHGRGQAMSDGSELYSGRSVRRFGFVFNLDPSNKSGSHWVSMFMNLGCVKPFVGYFDSYGQCPPPQQITVLMDRLKQQVKSCLGIDVVKRCNTIRHQRKNTECGVYSIYFIYNCLRDRSFEDITENIILDDDVNRYRDFFFRPNDLQNYDSIANAVALSDEENGSDDEAA